MPNRYVCLAANSLLVLILNLYLLQRGWQVDLTADRIYFAKKTEEKVEIPNEKLISANLQYARELEQIV